MKLIVGLGNPGKEYDMTRHNTGFYCLDVLSDEMNQSIDKEKFKGLYTKFKYKGEDVILLKPQTYMNNSGESVAAVMQFFKIPVEDLLVIYDDMDMPTGKLRLREKGSAGGHNGIKSIIAHVGTPKQVHCFIRSSASILLSTPPPDTAVFFAVTSMLHGGKAASMSSNVTVFRSKIRQMLSLSAAAAFQRI